MNTTGVLFLVLFFSIVVCAAKCQDVGINGVIYSDIILDDDLSSEGDCLIIGTDNVTIDCAGHRLVGSGTGIGIYVFGRQNVKILNCKVERFGYGIKASYSGSSFFQGNEVKNCYIGIHSSSSSDLIFSKNSAMSCGTGVYIYDVTGIVVSEGTITDNTGYGMDIRSSFFGKIRNNDFSRNRIGIKVHSSSDMEISGNNLRDCYASYEEEFVKKVSFYGNSIDFISGRTWAVLLTKAREAFALCLLILVIVAMIFIIGKGRKRGE